MNLQTTLELYSGGLGSGRKPGDVSRQEQQSLYTEGGWLSSGGKGYPGMGHGVHAKYWGLVPKNTKHLMEQTVAMNSGHIRVFPSEDKNDNAHFEAAHYDKRTKNALLKFFSKYPTDRSVSLEFEKPRHTLKYFDSVDDAKDWLESH
ncbi:MAG: hypothetical protein KGI50_06600 [Patescibacteria group bacterium]|nr:hypothetical protein [Patescibacteria group bacterium]MDE2439118.1 hypothetical protein [Patescibacteria group bacterium]